MKRTSALCSAALVLAVTLSACGADEPEDAGTAPTETTEDQTTEDTDDAAATSEDTAATSDDAAQSGDAAGGTSSGEAVVATTDSEFGTILVDGEGMTLYLFTQDTPNTSTCFDQCLEAWPILEGEPTAGEGVDESLLGSIERDDGTVQATYNEWPLYYFAQDQAPGDTTGQAVNDVWWVIDTEGAAITTAP
jgi:predicted lipoprotein with Yx(FWY)xxD motif